MRAAGARWTEGTRRGRWRTAADGVVPELPPRREWGGRITLPAGAVLAIIYFFTLRSIFG